MHRAIRAPKDFWSGLVFILIGLAGLVLSSGYALGTAGRMGPGYFPTVLGGMLVLVGLASMLRSLLCPGPEIGKFAIRKAFFVLLSTVLFGLLARGAGLAVAIVLVVLASGLASVKFRTKSFGFLAAGLAVFGVLVFVYALGMPIPIFGPWLGF